MSPVEHVISIGPVQLAASGQGLVQLDQRGCAVSSAHTEQTPRLVNLKTGLRDILMERKSLNNDLETVEGRVRHLDVEDGYLVVVEEVPHLHVPKCFPSYVT